MSGCLPTGSGRHIVETTPAYLDRVTPPYVAREVGNKFLPIEGQPGELIWITGVSTECINKQGETMPDQHLGYSTLDFHYPEWHNQKLDTVQASRLFALGAGSREYTLPPGYGVPLMSNEPLWYTSRVANPDPYFPAQRLSQRLELRYTRRRGLEHPLKSVTVRTLSVVDSGSHLWEVPPGSKTAVTEVTPLLHLSEKTNLVGAQVVMYRFARRAALVDLTSGEELLVLNATTNQKGEVQGLESYADPEGIVLDPSHRYAVRAEYENIGEQTVLGAAYWQVYLTDSKFELPAR